MNIFRVKLAVIAFFSMMALLVFPSNAHAAERSCSSTDVKVSGTAAVGSAWLAVSHSFPDSYLQTRKVTRTFPEAARRQACEYANEDSVKIARSRNSVDDFAKLLCKDAKQKYQGEHANAGHQVKLKSVWAVSSREIGTSHSYDLNGQVFQCAQFEESTPTPSTSNLTRKASQFCGDYATSAMRMDRAIEQLGCHVEKHGTEDGHRNYCSQRSDEVVANGIRYKRGLLNQCLDSLPLH